MKETTPIQQATHRVFDLVKQYFNHRLQSQSLPALNAIVHDLRMVLHVLIVDYFMVLPLPKAQEFHGAFVDQLTTLCGQIDVTCSLEDKDHCRSFVKQIVQCFDMAAQIREEIPHDTVTQKILAVDIPILRPFDYGLSATKRGKRSCRKC